jgi:hypothetical protein
VAWVAWLPLSDLTESPPNSTKFDVVAVFSASQIYVVVVVAVKNNNPFENADEAEVNKVPPYELVDVMRTMAALKPAFPFEIRPRSILYCCPTIVESA